MINDISEKKLKNTDTKMTFLQPIQKVSVQESVNNAKTISQSPIS